MKVKICFFIGVVIVVLVTVIVLFRYNSSQGIKNVKNNIQEDVFIDVNMFYGKTIDDIKEMFDRELNDTFGEYEYSIVPTRYGDVYTFAFENLPYTVIDKYGATDVEIAFFYNPKYESEYFYKVVIITDNTLDVGKNDEELLKIFNLNRSKYMIYNYSSKRYQSENEKIKMFWSFDSSYSHIDGSTSSSKVFHFIFNPDEPSEVIWDNPNLKTYRRTELEKRKVPKLDNTIDFNKILGLEIDELETYAIENNWYAFNIESNLREYLINDIPKKIAEEKGFNALILSVIYENEEAIFINMFFCKLERNTEIDYYDIINESIVDIQVDKHEEILDMFNIKYMEKKKYNVSSSDTDIYEFIEDNISEVFISGVYRISRLEIIK